MSLKDEVDDSIYIQQQWENNFYENEHEIQDILSQFSVNQELRNLQLNFFGMSEPLVDPHLQLPGNNDFFQMAAQPGGKDSLLGKRNFKEPKSSIQTPENTLQPLPTPNKRQKKIIEKTTKITKEIQKNIPIMKEGKQTKECHNMNERQRRLKINQKIQDLKELLPRSYADILTNKLAILHESVDHIQNLHHAVDHLNERNFFLEQRLIENENQLLILKQFNNNNFINNNDNNNNNNIINNNDNNNDNNNNNNDNDNNNDNSLDQSPLNNLLSNQYQHKLPSNLIINYNLQSPISSLFNH